MYDTLEEKIQVLKKDRSNNKAYTLYWKDVDNTLIGIYEELQQKIIEADNNWVTFTR